MSDPIGVVEELYGSRYKGDPLWDNVVKKLTVRQAYVFYYSLAYHDKTHLSVNLGLLDLPDKSEVHRCLIDVLRKREDPYKVAQIIGDNAHKILINDNDLLWIKSELRASIWLSHFIITYNYSNRSFKSSYLRSTSEAEFINRLLHVIDIYGCGTRGEKIYLIKVAFDNNTHDLDIDHRTAFNNYRGNYISNRIADHHLNWFSKLPLDEIDAILERFKADEILVLVGVFEPVSKKDKVTLIRASLDIQQYNHRNEQERQSLLFNKSNDNVGQTRSLSDESKDIDTEKNKRSKKKFANQSAFEIITLLKNARISRENRKVRSTTKKDRSLTLNKNAYDKITSLSKQLNATPKKVIEALIKNFNLDNEDELSRMDKLISGRRSSKVKVGLEKVIIDESIEPSENYDYTGLDQPVEPVEVSEFKQSDEAEETAKESEINQEK